MTTLAVLLAHKFRWIHWCKGVVRVKNPPHHHVTARAGELTFLFYAQQLLMSDCIYDIAWCMYYTLELAVCIKLINQFHFYSGFQDAVIIKRFFMQINVCVIYISFFVVRLCFSICFYFYLCNILALYVYTENIFGYCNYPYIHTHTHTLILLMYAYLANPECLKICVIIFHVIWNC